MMHEADIRRLFPHASRSLLEANARRIPDAEPAKPARKVGALDVADEGEAPRTGCPAVRFTLFRVNLLDVDAKHGSCKDLLDALRYAGAIYGDREGEITLEVEQVKVRHYAEEKTEIEVIYP